MTAIRQPRSTAAATDLCERWATIDGQIAEIEERRQADIAAINADADRAATDLIAQRDAITEKLEPWWAKARVGQLKGKRWAKSLLRVTTSLDATAIGKALDGKHAAKLKEIGFTMVPGDETFFVQRTEQLGTRT